MICALQCRSSTNSWLSELGAIDWTSWRVLPATFKGLQGRLPVGILYNEKHGAEDQLKKSWKYVRSTHGLTFGCCYVSKNNFNMTMKV